MGAAIRRKGVAHRVVFSPCTGNASLTTRACRYTFIGDALKFKHRGYNPMPLLGVTKGGANDYARVRRQTAQPWAACDAVHATGNASYSRSSADQRTRGFPGNRAHDNDPQHCPAEAIVVRRGLARRCRQSSAHRSHQRARTGKVARRIWRLATGTVTYFGPAGCRCGQSTSIDYAPARNETFQSHCKGWR